jgi:flagellar biosynthesis chaperone FliJ
MARSLDLTASQVNLLEVCGFDLLAQVEALLRYSREYQRDVLRFQRAATNASTLGALRRQISNLRHACASLQRTVELISDTDQSARRTPAEPQAFSTPATLRT